MAKVLITGATGFIGNHVTRLCLEKGDDVRVMVMPGEDRSPLDGMDVEFVEGNLLDPQSLPKTVEGVEQLYHLAAMFSIWTKDPDLHFKINVDGARAMLRAAMAANVQKVVFTSSVAAIGIEEGKWSTEETEFNSWPWASSRKMSPRKGTQWPQRGERPTTSTIRAPNTNLYLDWKFRARLGP